MERDSDNTQSEFKDSDGIPQEAKSPGVICGEDSLSNQDSLGVLDKGNGGETKGVPAKPERYGKMMQRAAVEASKVDIVARSEGLAGHLDRAWEKMKGMDYGKDLRLAELIRGEDTLARISRGESGSSAMGDLLRIQAMTQAQLLRIVEGVILSNHHLSPSYQQEAIIDAEVVEPGTQ